MVGGGKAAANERMGHATVRLFEMAARGVPYLRYWSIQPIACPRSSCPADCGRAGAKRRGIRPGAAYAPR